MLQTIVHMSANLTQLLSFYSCNIETKGLKFNSEIKFTLPWIKLWSCSDITGESSELKGELEDIVEAISNSQLKTSINKFLFTDEDDNITEEEVKLVLQGKGLENITLSEF